MFVFKSNLKGLRTRVFIKGVPFNIKFLEGTYKTDREDVKEALLNSQSCGKFSDGYVIEFVDYSNRIKPIIKNRNIDNELKKEEKKINLNNLPLDVSYESGKNTVNSDNGNSIIEIDNKVDNKQNILNVNTNTSNIKDEKPHDKFKNRNKRKY
jgi:hypothetical protein